MKRFRNEQCHFNRRESLIERTTGGKKWVASVWEAQKMLIIVQGIEILMLSLMAQVDLIKQFKIMDMVIITSFGRRKMSSGANCFDHFSESSGSAIPG